MSEQVEISTNEKNKQENEESKRDKKRNKKPEQPSPESNSEEKDKDKENNDENKGSEIEKNPVNKVKHSVINDSAKSDVKKKSKIFPILMLIFGASLAVLIGLVVARRFTPSNKIKDKLTTDKQEGAC